MSMTTEDGIRTAVGGWLRGALADAERRGLPGLAPLLEGLAESTIALRKADWNDHLPEDEPGSGNGACPPAPEGSKAGRVER
jgi:hypothetical protein